jgi:thiosulfate/3-mercaptopyruvate sulfurtransferase
MMILIHLEKFYEGRVNMKGAFAKLIALGVFLVVMMASIFVSSAQAQRGIDPIVSADWLGVNIVDPNLVILDIRSAEEYAKGHIPGAINVPFEVPVSAWIVMKDGLLLELPPAEELFNTVGKAGITKDSKVVIVGRTTDPMAPYAMANATRVAITLIYAGVKNVAILDGGFDRWKWEGKAVSKVKAVPKPVKYEGSLRKDMFITKDEVKEKIGKAIIIDGRDPDVYFGVKAEPWAPRLGHIPTAKNLPTPWLWNLTKDYGMYKDMELIKEMMKELIGEPSQGKEIIVYCGVGGYGSTLWYILSEVLGYPNVKLYDGSAQEWSMDERLPLVKFKWE